MRFGKHEVEERPGSFGGERYVKQFPNGYGASIIRNGISYGHEVGRWELMVLKDGEACYTTYITDDVLGWLSEEEVTSTLDEIKELEA